MADRQPRLLPPEAVTRIGLIALSTDLTIEGDARRLLPVEAALHVTRVEYANPTTPENLARMQPRLAAAAGLLAHSGPFSAMGFGCTAASAVIGDKVVADAVASAGVTCPVMTPTLAARGALADMGLTRIALLTPYLPQTTEPMVAYFADFGIDVIKAHCLGFSDDRDMARIAPDEVIAAALATDHPQAEALFLSCTALPAVPLVERIEAALGKPVLCSNQVLFRSLLLQAGLPMPRGFGRVFDVKGTA
ncbi:ectoine utilization protein EutA [Tropicimonas sp. IMCC34043]|uniref:maleate cis-trans isomerase family protein n=1 Tax=Tropicimonas sp. IMCC34043 TaxID=2248760 RepID=UPI00130088AB|nr:ectoine utilization protein EutA [Tropicimonas sp. IMCC34043]